MVELKKKRLLLGRWFSRDLGKKVPSSLAPSSAQEDFITDIRPSRHRKSYMANSLHLILAIAMVFLVLGIIALFFIYLLQVKSLSASKNDLAQRALAAAENIEGDHVAYLLNELGAYKLHPSFLDAQSPVIMIWITNTGQKFITRFKDGELTVTEGDTDDYDIIISLEDSIFRKVYGSKNQRSESRIQIERKRISIDKKEKDFPLGLRGYLAFKEYIFPPEAALFFFTENQLRALYLVIVVLILFFTLWYFRNV